MSLSTSLSATPVSRRLARTILRPFTKFDIYAVLCSTFFQIVIIILSFSLPAQEAQFADEPISSAQEIFLHNLLVFTFWIMGGLTVGMLTIILALLSSVMTGIALKSIVEAYGLVSLSAMGHAVLELPAFGIALWIGFRPFFWIVRARFSKRAAEPLLEFVCRSLLWWIVLGVILLGGAAFWEAAIPVPVRR